MRLGSDFSRFGHIFLQEQGRRRVFKSGPAEEAIECRSHERGESTRVGLSPLDKGIIVWGGGGLPRENF